MISMQMDLDESDMLNLDQSLPELDYDSEFLKFEDILRQNNVINGQTFESLLNDPASKAQDFKKQKENLRVLEESTKRAARLEEETKSSTERMKIVQQNIDKNESEILRFQGEYDSLQCAVLSKESELTELQRRRENEGDVVDRAKEKMLADLDKWKKVLSLELVTTTRRSTVFVFTNLLREDPERKCKCEVGQENSRFKIHGCAPPLSDVQMLEEKLNTTMDMSGFVFTLRKKFIELLEAPEGQ